MNTAILNGIETLMIRPDPDPPNCENRFRIRPNTTNPIKIPISGRASVPDSRHSETSQHNLGKFSVGDASHVEEAIQCAMKAKSAWSSLPWESRATIFLKAADLLAGPYRDEMNAATMLCQSKNVFQAEIDASCELIDFLRFNVAYMQQIYAEQPESADGILNRLEYRPLEGFVFAITPFNFNAIAANLCAAPAMMGNVIVWKPAETQMYSAHVIMKLFKEAGLPDGVINFVPMKGENFLNTVISHTDFSGLLYTGSSSVFDGILKKTYQNDLVCFVYSVAILPEQHLHSQIH